MPTPPMTDAEILRRVDALRHFEGNFCHAARVIGVASAQIHRAYNLAQQRGLCPPVERAGRTNDSGNYRPFSDFEPWQDPLYTPDQETVRPTMPDFGARDLPVEERIQHHADRSEIRLQHRRRKEWFALPIDTRKPIALVLIGDPHLDDDGVHWKAMLRDIAMIKEASEATGGAVWCVNVGDTINNWPIGGGKLGKLWAHQSASITDAMDYTRWFMHSAGLPWLMWLLGNHEAMNDLSSMLFAEMADDAFLVEDWQAKFRLTFANDRECGIHIAHSMKGTSIYNPGHGMLRQALLNTKHPVRLFAQGHHHDSWLHQGRHPDYDMSFWGLKVRGYKFVDSYADKHQFNHTAYGCSGVAVIDPRRDEAEDDFIFATTNLKFGLDLLKYKRGVL